MTKLVVEVIDASDLMPKDGQGSSSPYVEVEYDGQVKRTQTKHKNLNPQWNEKLVFNVNNPRDLLYKLIEVVVYNDRKGGGHHKHFLGRVRISGVSVPFSESEASIQRYPLDKRGLFSYISGDIALRIHAIPSESDDGAVPRDENLGNLPRYINTEYRRGDDRKVKEKREKELRTFHSIGAAPQMKETADGTGTTRADFAKAGPPGSVQMMQVPKQNPEYDIVETRPPLAARMRYLVGDKTTSTYDLVEQMHFLYVNVVKGKDLPAMNVSGTLDPYVEVKIGNYRGFTKHLEENQNPVWNQIFAFAKEQLQTSILEVIVRDKDIGLDDFVGRVVFDVAEVPVRVPPDSPLAPEWYKLEDRRGVRVAGEVMLGVWMGTQADECYPDAWHSDAHSVSQANLPNTRSKVYFSPKLYYIRVHVFEAQDLVPSEKGSAPDTYVKVLLGGNQGRVTRPSPVKTIHPVWKDELVFVTPEPFNDFFVVSVEDTVSASSLGRFVIPVREIIQRTDHKKVPEARWFNLHKPPTEEHVQKPEAKFNSKILVRFCLEAGYHVLDESTNFSSNLQPSSNALRKPSIGILEVGILNAKNLVPMKAKDGRTTDAYCVAKYGNKWVRTRTLLDTSAPRWNEQYTWEVYDPCTVVTIGVFDNCHINGKDDGNDQKMGKLRIRLSTLETDRVYTHYYPLLVLHPSGLKKHGELQLAIRFTCTAWAKMITQYGKPLLPKMHYIQPLPMNQMEYLRHIATSKVASRLVQAEPPLRMEVIEYMLDVDMNAFSLRKSKANFHRMMSLLSAVTAAGKWFNDLAYWRNPIATCLAHILFLILIFYPELILPTIFLYLFIIGLWNYRFRPIHPPYMDARLSQAESAHPDEIDEEFDTYPTTKTRHMDIVRNRYDRLRTVAGRVQSVAGDLANHGERAHALLSWRDPRATAIFIVFALVSAVLIYVTPFRAVAIILLFYLLRHPRFRSKLPPVPVNFFKRLPDKSDLLI